MKRKDFFGYWGKTATSDAVSEPYHLLAYHSLDVAAVGHVLLQKNQQLLTDLAEFLDLPPEQFKQMFVFSLLLHDLGKFAAAFQGLKVFSDSPLIDFSTKPHKSKLSYDASQARHDVLGLAIWKVLEQKDLLPFSTLLQNDFFEIWMGSAFGHHGKPVGVSRQNARLQIKKYGGDSVVEHTSDFIRDAFQLYPVDWPYEKMQQPEWIDRVKQISWHLAGLAIACDWLGSDNQQFIYQTTPMPLPDYWQNCALPIAEKAVAKSDLFKTFAVKDFSSVTELFGFTPSPLQAWAEKVELEQGPQLFILEDNTGAGKTEAALTLAHRLMAAGRGSGLYFGLPTMATSNAMYSRLAEHYQQFYAGDDAPSIVLAHGANKMHEQFREAVLASKRKEDDYSKADTSTSAYCNQWLADSRKKALLAPVAIGTVDQVMMAALPYKHQTLRLLGLHNKTLIVDEIHAADSFMLQILYSLLEIHMRQGGSAILLSATLSMQQREQLAQCWQVEPEPITINCDKFPLATQVSCYGQTVEKPIDSRKQAEKSLPVKFIHSVDDCIELLLEAHRRGECAVWVRNSVDDAFKAFNLLQQALGSNESLLLFHSRFVLADRQHKEQQVLEVFGKHATAESRVGKILVSSQVFQESIDADCDLMLSDICPIDDLIQRAGRNRRHTRDANGVYQANTPDQRPPATLYVHAPEWDLEPQKDWLEKDFRNTSYVYRNHGQLWLGMKVLQECDGIFMPRDARRLIEGVYSEEAKDHIPDNLLNSHLLVAGQDRQKINQANHQLLNWQLGFVPDSAANNAWLDDDLEVSTRHSDLVYKTLLLLKAKQGQLVPWVEHACHAVALSCIKLTEHKAKQLTPLPDKWQPAFDALCEQYPEAKYFQPWLVEEDAQFGYDMNKGAYQFD